VTPKGRDFGGLFKQCWMLRMRSITTCHKRITTMKFVGVDLHKKTITIAIVDAQRKLCSRKRFSNLMSVQIVAFLKDVGEFQLTVEAIASYEWFVQLVEPLANRIVLAHPGKLRVIAESTRKSDKLDATVLAEMLALEPRPHFECPVGRSNDDEFQALVTRRACYA
jgi:hypothetical protein